MDFTNLTEQQKLDFKQKLKGICIDKLQERITNIEQAMESAQESANSEDKSSAGDKYETGRAMGQLNREMHAKQLEDARYELGSLEAVNSSELYTSVNSGAVVVCKGFVFFIAAGLGNVVIEEQKLVMLSPQAPLAVQLHKKKAGDSFTFNSKTFDILDVF